MAKRSRKNQEIQHKLEDMVVVTFTQDLEQAKDYETLLKNNDIPAMIKEQNEQSEEESKGIAIMVPEDYLDEAHVVIESQDAYDDFYDFTVEDDEDELDEEFYEGEL
jgi:hypothetical protein